MDIIIQCKHPTFRRFGRSLGLEPQLVAVVEGEHDPSAGRPAVPKGSDAAFAITRAEYERAQKETAHPSCPYQLRDPSQTEGDIAAATGRLAALRESIDAQSRRLSEMNQAREQAEKELERLTAEREALTRDKEQLEQRVADFEKRAAEAEEKADKARAELEKLKAARTRKAKARAKADEDGE